MAKFTLLEVHLDGAQLTANAPFSGESQVSEEGESEPEITVGEVGEEADGGGKKRWVAALVVLVFLVVVAAVAKQKLGGDYEAVPELQGREDQLDDVDA